jgi:hypothetical protein
MPLTREQIARRQAEGSLRRRFDYYITHLADQRLTDLDDLWEGIWRMMDVVLDEVAVMPRQDWERTAATWSPPPEGLPFPSWLPGFPRWGGTPEAGCGSQDLTPRVFQRFRTPDLVAGVPAHRAPVASPVDRSQVRQLKPQVRPFAHGDHVVDLTGADTTRDAVKTDVTEGSVCGVDKLGELLPAETATAHRRHEVSITQGKETGEQARVR